MNGNQSAYVLDSYSLIAVMLMSFRWPREGKDSAKVGQFSRKRLGDF